MTVIAFVAFFVICVLALVLGLTHRSALGDTHGNLLLVVEGIVATLAWATYRLLRTRKTRAAVLVGLYGGAALLLFLSWFLHPTQVVGRVADRLVDLELQVAHQQNAGRRPSDVQATRDYVARLQAELVVRRTEYEAALDRYLHDKQRGNLPLLSYLLAAVGAIVALSCSLFQSGRWPFRKSA